MVETFLSECEKREEYLRMIFGSSKDGITVVDEQGRFEFANDSFFGIIGWPGEEILGHQFKKIIPDDEWDSIIQKWSKVQEGILDEFETRIITRNGEKKYVKIAHTLTTINGEKKVVSVTSDITGYKELESRIKESEAKYRDLFENANDPMYIQDVNGFILNANKAGLAGLKCTREEFIGSNMSRWLTQESFLQCKERLIKRMAGEPVEQPAVIEVLCKDGEHRWAEIRTRIVYENEKVKEIHGIARDITEKKRLEEKLRESEAKYRDLFENAQDAMYVLDTQGNFLKMNQIGLQTLGFTREEVIGNNISKFVTPASLTIVKERQKKRLQGEIVDQTNVLEIMCKNGERRWVEIKTRDIKDDDKIIEIHGIARDITENRKLKQELKISNKQRKLLFYLIEGTRGGKTRALILKHLNDRSHNAHQLAKILKMDYKTIRHHLDVLIKNGIIIKDNNDRTNVYSISKNMELEMNMFNNDFDG